MGFDWQVMLLCILLKWPLTFWGAWLRGSIFASRLVDLGLNLDALKIYTYNFEYNIRSKRGVAWKK